MIIDPWGTVRAEAGDEPGLAMAEIDLDQIEATRRGLPMADHRRLIGNRVVDRGTTG